ncbi:MAG: hypothetical protein NTZ19_15955 [Bacteroidetes bacterium]|nr:hypothetical protein [Bacteroidota bacterium]
MFKKIIQYTGMLLIMAIAFTGCYQDVILPDATVDPDGPPQAVSFSGEIATMVNTKCALAGCHVAGGHKPNMTIGGSFKEIVNGGFVNTIIPKESIIYQKINGEMKEYIPSAVDRQKIYDWIRNGALNN